MQAYYCKKFTFSVVYTAHFQLNIIEFCVNHEYFEPAISNIFGFLMLVWPITFWQKWKKTRPKKNQPKNEI